MLVLDENGIPVPLVDLQGKFTSHMGEYAGKYVKNEYYDEGQAPEKSVDVEIAIRLKEENQSIQSREIRAQLSTQLENRRAAYYITR